MRWKSVKHNSNNINKDVKSYIRATCFDSTESSSGPRVSDPYKDALRIVGSPTLTIKQNYKIIKPITKQNVCRA